MSGKEGKGRDKSLGIRDGQGAEQYNGRSGGGESGGGPYPNPHTGKEPGNDGFMGHGGQTEMPYHGPGQLGNEDADDAGNENAPARKTKPGA